MLVLRGAPALSDFRRDKLVRRLQDEFKAGCNLSARFVHFVDAERESSDVEQAVLAQLLTYGPSAQQQGDAPGGLFLVVPRRETLSKPKRLRPCCMTA